MDYSSIKLYRSSDEPLHLQLTKQLRRLALSSSAPSPLPSERSLCELLKLNRSTVHRAYETLLQEGVVAATAKRQLEFLPGAKRRLAGAFPSVGVLLPESFSSFIDWNNGSGLRYLKGIFDRAAELECAVFILQIPPPESSEKEVNAFIEGNFHKLIGIIHLGGRECHNDKPLEQVFKYDKLPPIFISGEPLLPHIGSVYTDFTAAGKEFGELLLKNNCRKIGIIISCGDPRESGYRYTALSRGALMKKLLTSCGLEIDGKWDISLPAHHSPEEELEKRFQKGIPLPDVFWCVNDTIAAEVMNFFKAKQLRVPEDIQIAGFDGTFVAEGLSSISQQFHQLGAEAVNLLWEHFEYGINEKNRFRCVEARFYPGKTIKV